MNKNYTLKELADIAKAAAEKANKESQEVQWGAVMSKADRPGFIWSETVRAILDAIGYEFPKDEEREAFERWLSEQGDGFHPCGDVDKAFAVWKAGREELRRSINKPHYSADEQIEQANKLVSDALKKTAVGVWGKSEPAWIPWEGGECPLPDRVKRWEFKYRDGTPCLTNNTPSEYRWWHSELDGLRSNDIVAYRVIEG